jgi:hypothetical protein
MQRQIGKRPGQVMMTKNSVDMDCDMFAWSVRTCNPRKIPLAPTSCSTILWIVLLHGVEMWVFYQLSGAADDKGLTINVTCLPVVVCVSGKRLISDNDDNITDGGKDKEQLGSDKPREGEGQRRRCCAFMYDAKHLSMVGQVAICS